MSIDSRKLKNTDLKNTDLEQYEKKRKTRKQNQKEIMKEYNQENSIQKQRNIYENIHHLSYNEQQLFEQKFCKPKNDSQYKFVSYLNDTTKKIVIATGPAGTGKTLFATQIAIRGFLLGTYDKILFTRPSVSVDEDLGFLPGTLEDKMAPWMRPLYDILYEHITPKEVVQLIEDKIIEICPLGFMRGRTFKNCCIIADECQNTSPQQMKLLLTRIGENCRVFITGDLEQCDRRTHDDSPKNGLEDFLDKIKGKRSESISSVEFDICDVEREKIVKEILEIYSTSTIPATFLKEDEPELEDV